MTAPAIWFYDLTPEAAVKIATMSLDWASVDLLLGSIIAENSGITEPKFATELVDTLDMMKKIEIIDRRRHRGDFLPEASALIDELVYIGAKYRPDSNMLSHGIRNEGGITWSQNKLKALELSEIDELAAEARYATHVAHHLSWAVWGIAPEAPLPPRPPQRD